MFQKPGRKPAFILALFLLLNAAFAAVCLMRPTMSVALEPSEITQENNHAYFYQLKNPNFLYNLKGDGMGAPARSDLRLFENGRLLSPAHSAHDHIRVSGGGAYSHWVKGLYFSSSDHSDPRTNGKKYSFEVRATVRLTIVVLWLFANCFLAGLLIFRLIRGAVFSLSALVGLIVSAGVVFFLYQNCISVVSVLGRVFYFCFSFFILVFVLILAFFDQRQAGQELSTAVRFVRRLQMVLVSFVYTLLFFECMCRVFPVAETLAVNPGCRYFWKDWYRYPVNSYGYREREIGAKQKDVYRVLIYGDSYVEGAGVARVDLAGIQLEKILNQKLADDKKKLRVEAFNLGHCGANTKDEVGWILKETPVLKPDLVVLSYIPNDPEMESVALVETKSSLFRDLAEFFTGDHGSYFYYRLLRESQMFSSRKSQPVASKSYLEMLHDDAYPGWHAVQKAFSEMSTFLASQKTDSFAIVLPIFHSRVGADMAAVTDKTAKEMRKRKIEGYNLLGYFTQDTPNVLAQYSFSSWDPHPNVLANRKIAEYLADNIWKRPGFKKAAGITK